jgi:hypothetical protein
MGVPQEHLWLKLRCATSPHGHVRPLLLQDLADKNLTVQVRSSSKRLLQDETSQLALFDVIFLRASFNESAR